MNPDALSASPLESATFLSKVFFCWLVDLFRLGSKRDLELSDLYRLSRKNKSENLCNALSQAWKDEISKTEEHNLMKKGSPRKPSLYGALVKVYFRPVAVLGVIVFLNECILKMAQPILLGYFIRYFAGEFDDTAGRLFGAGIFISTAMFAINFHPFYFLIISIGMRCRVACSSLIYRKLVRLKDDVFKSHIFPASKALSSGNALNDRCTIIFQSLRLSQASIAKSNVGQMVNLLANDVNRFDLSVCYLHYLWVGPIQLAIVTYILWGYYEWISLVGAAVLISFVPLQSLMGKLFGKLRLQVAERTDHRVRIMSEIVNAVRIIKMYAWEFPFEKLVHDAREDEIKYIRKTAYLRAVNLSCFNISSKITVFVTLLTYILTGHILSAEKVFVTMLLFHNVRSTMTYYFAHAIQQVAEVLASIKRIDEFLLMEERDGPPNQMARKYINDPSGHHMHQEITAEVTVTKVSARWTGAASADTNTLEDVSLHVGAGQLLAVVGPVGSGKTSLLHVLLHELPAIKGDVNIKGTIAYTNQQPWIFSGTVRENILFGRDFEYDRYQQVIQACALSKDLMLLPFQDQTIVGDKGISLSGGQKARVNLARAVYSDADIYLLDDPLSAVDAEVGKHMFEKCIMGILREKVKILVTHQLQFLMPADEIILLGGGKVEARGSYKELVNTRKDFASALLPEEKAPLRRENSLGERPQHSFKLRGMRREGHTASANIRRMSSISFSEMQSVVMTEIEYDEEPTPLKTYRSHGGSRRGSRPLLRHLSKQKKITEVLESVPNSDLDEVVPLNPKPHEESKSSGEIPISLYWKYIRAGISWFGLLILLVFNILAQSLYSGSDYWLEYWTKDEQNKTGDALQHYVENHRNERVYVYCGFIGALIFVYLIKNFAFLNVCVNSSVELHRGLFEGVMRAPMRFFELNAAGRVMSRFAKDIGIIDEMLPMNLFETVEVALQLFGAVTIVSINIPYMVIPSVFLTVLFYFIRKFYLKTANSVRRLEGLARSPVFNHLSTSIAGLTTIRAMKAEHQFEKQFDIHQDLHSASWFLFLATPRWLGVVVDSWCVLYIGIILLTFLLRKGENKANKSSRLKTPISSRNDSISAIGLTIASSMSLVVMFQFGIRHSTEAENHMVSVERVQEYADTEPEASLESTPETKPPKDWPTKGEIVFKSLVMKYGEDDPVLKNINCVFNSQEKVGIVGRTGAGKSSLITALFRITEPYEGAIEIDGINVLKIGLHDLRKNISIIPQDPVLFNATLRKNLDPFGDYEDKMLWTALDDVYLSDTVKEYPAGIDTQIAEDGSNFSVGQRQLICLARAILRRSTMLVLDEATAAVDHQTDALIQRTIREKFATCTVLTIAHRLNTVMDSDRILVLDAGEVKEFDEPYTLLCNEASSLSQLVKTTGKTTAAVLLEIAKVTYETRRPAKIEKPKPKDKDLGSSIFYD